MTSRSGRRSNHEITLLDTETGIIAARFTTDADGKFSTTVPPCKCSVGGRRRGSKREGQIPPDERGRHNSAPTLSALRRTDVCFC